MKPLATPLLLAGLAVTGAALAQAPAAPAEKSMAHITVTATCRPEYPLAALRTSATGSTRLHFAVDRTGRVIGGEVVKSSGPTREHRLLDDNARTALARCSFTPALDANGTPVPSSVDVTWVWKLQ